MSATRPKDPRQPETGTPWAWSPSIDSERWELAGHSREEAIDYARDNSDTEDGEPCGWIQEAKYLDPGEVAAWAINMDQLLESMDEFDAVWGCFDEPVFVLADPKSTAAAEAALAAAVARWAKKYVTTNGKFVCCGKPEQVPPAPLEAR